MPLSFPTILKLTRFDSTDRSTAAYTRGFRETRSKSNLFNFICVRSVLVFCSALCLALTGCVANAVEPSPLKANDTTTPILTGFTCSSASMSGSGTNTCTVTLNGPAPAAGVRVALSSNNAAVPVSSAALVHASSTSVQFSVGVSAVTTAQTAVLTACAGSVTVTFNLQLTPPVPTLSLSVASVAFGSVSVNTPATQTITLKSTGTGPVTVSAAKVTGTDFSMTQGTFPVTLNPGQTAAIVVQYKPTVLGAESGQLTVSSNSSVNSTATVPLSGTGLPVLTGFTCANATMSGTGTDLCTVTLSGPAPSAGFRVALSSNNAAVSISSAALVHASMTSVQFSVSVSAVSTPQTVILTASAGPVINTFTLQLTAPVPTLSISVASVAFGSVSQNTPATQAVTLSSTGTGPVTVSAAAVTGSDFSMTPGTFPVTLNPGQSATVTVQYNPTVLGAESGQLTVSSNSSTGSTATVPLSGTGIPVLTGFSCASASMSGAGSDVCTLTLSGPAPSAGFRVGLSSNNAAVPMPSAALVHAGNTSLQFTLSVAAVSTAQTALLTASAGPVTDTFTLQLNAAQPALNLGAASVAFGNVPVNVITTRPLTLTSSGQATLTVSGATVAGSGFSVAPGTLPVSLSPGQTATINVQFNPAAAGAATGQLTIASNSSTGTTATISLSGTGATTGAFSYSGSTLTSTLTPPSSTATISGNFFGMTIHHTATPFPAFPVSAFRFWDVSAWSDIEPSDGQFNWSHIDSAISTATAKGVSDFVFTFGAVPAWASTNPSDPCTGGEGIASCTAPNMTAFDAFAKQIVQRYCGKIKYYETWNEPNSTGYWSGTNAQLLSVSQDLYTIAKDPANCGCTNGVCAPNGGANPNQVLLPSISRVTTSNLNWLDSYLATAGAQYPYADVATFHGYGDTNADQIATDVQSLDVTLAKHGLASLPLWNTEASWGPMTTVDQDEVAWLMRYHVVQAAAGVSRFIWYAYDDCGWGTLWEAPWCTSPQMPTSQVTAPGQAYAVIESWLIGANLIGCQQYANGLWACELQRSGGYDGWMIWSSTGTTITVPVPDSFGLTVYRDSQNNVNALPSSIAVDETPVLLENYDL